jgi:hypothetical protein
MKKFNEFEAHLLGQGLKVYVEAVIEEIIIAEQKGERPIMTADYMRMIERETLEKLKSLTIKKK